MTTALGVYRCMNLQYCAVTVTLGVFRLTELQHSTLTGVSCENYFGDGTAAALSD